MQGLIAHLAAGLGAGLTVIGAGYGIGRLAGSALEGMARLGNKDAARELTFMASGKKRVERIPKDWVEEVRRRVEAGREFQDALREVLTANAELLVLWRKQKTR